MRAFFTFIVLLNFVFNSYSQNSGLSLLDCYFHGDTISIAELKKAKIIGVKDDYMLKVSEYTLEVYKGKSDYTEVKVNSNLLTSEVIQKITPGVNKIVFSKVKILFKNGTLRDTDDFELNISDKGTKICGSNNVISAKKEIKGKLLTGNNSDIPLINQKIILKKENKYVQSTITDKYGDFAFEVDDSKGTYIIEIPNQENKIKHEKIVIAKQNGEVINSFKKINNTFVYELLPSDINKLSNEKEEDSTLKVRKFIKTSEREITIVEDILYDLNSSKIKNESFVLVDKIVVLMRENEMLKLSVTSHTDSRGDDNYNLELSNKRAKEVLDYLITKGIKKERVSAKGLGETQIKNRCKNNVDCSEEEHSLNRRTEFKFSK